MGFLGVFRVFRRPFRACRYDAPSLNKLFELLDGLPAHETEPADEAKEHKVRVLVEAGGHLGELGRGFDGERRQDCALLRRQLDEVLGQLDLGRRELPDGRDGEIR